MAAIQIDSLIFFIGNRFIFSTISMKCVPKGPNYNEPDMMQIMAYRRAGDKPLPEPSKAGFFTHRCVTPLREVDMSNKHLKDIFQATNVW